LTNIFGELGYKILGVGFFGFMAFVLYRIAIAKRKNEESLELLE
jgi:hypothetical protein